MRKRYKKKAGHKPKAGPGNMFPDPALRLGSHFYLLLYDSHIEPGCMITGRQGSLRSLTTFFLNRFTIWERWGISSPKPLAWGPESGELAWSCRKRPSLRFPTLRLPVSPTGRGRLRSPRPLPRFALIARLFLRIASHDALQAQRLLDQQHHAEGGGHQDRRQRGNGRVEVILHIAHDLNRQHRHARTGQERRERHVVE